MDQLQELARRVRALERRISELEASEALRDLRGPTSDERILEETCGQVGVGIREIQGDGRNGDTVRARQVIARALREKSGWSVRRIARAMRKTRRAVGKMITSSH